MDQTAGHGSLMLGHVTIDKRVTYWLVSLRLTYINVNVCSNHVHIKLATTLPVYVQAGKYLATVKNYQLLQCVKNRLEAVKCFRFRLYGMNREN